MSDEMPHRAVIFDCDGTLVDSEGIGIQVLLDVALEHGATFDGASMESGAAESSDAAALVRTLDGMVQALRGLPMAECLIELERRGRFRFSQDVVGAIRERTASAFRAQLSEIPGATDFVQRLKVPYCVASSGPREKIELSLGLTGLLPFFEGRIFSSYELGSWKPEPDLFLLAARTLGLAPEDCAVIEDSQPGVDAGVAAGMFVYAFGEANLTLPPRARGVRVGDYRQLRERFHGLLNDRVGIAP
jgi:HAD superfamily hydrolase (TIGR01509 family)